MKGVSQSFEFVGRIKAIDKVDLRARVEGFLEKVLFREGQDVKAGDLLYQIEKVQFQAQVDQAKANLAVAEAELTNAQLAIRPRSSSWSKHQFSPQSQVDQNKAALDTATGQGAAEQAALTQAQVNLDYTDIRAPIDGRIGRTAYTVGNLVNPASGVLATIVSQDPIYVLFPVSVRDLETIREARRKEEGGLAKIDIRVRLPNGTGIPAARRLEPDRPAGRPADRHADHAGDHPQSRPAADRRPVRHGRHPRAPGSAAAGGAAGGAAGRPVRLLRAGRRRPAQGRAAARADRSAAQAPTSSSTSGVKEGEKVIVDGIQKVRPGQVVQETELPAGSGG